MNLTEILISQYLASLDMLRQAIILCPGERWDAPSSRRKFWHLAYHTLFFTHLYLEESEENFIPFPMHRERYEQLDASPDGEPYNKGSILEYLAFCVQRVKDRLPRMDLEGPEGHGDRSFILAELQIYAIRHIMQHTGELMERLSDLDEEINWVGSVRELPGYADAEHRP